jgi:hypothetical protein
VDASAASSWMIVVCGPFDHHELTVAAGEHDRPTLLV